MKIGVISEGHSDRAVIENIIVGITGLDRNDIVALRPIYTTDETDKAFIGTKAFSTWSVVKDECEKRELIDGFLAFEGQDFVVIHIDTAEAEHYGILRPAKKSADYCIELRALVVQQIESWLNKGMSNEILFAIAIEEMDAWILTIYDSHDSTSSIKPKEKLDFILGKKGINSTSDYENFLHLSKPLSKERVVKKGKFLEYNCSLKAFFEEVKTKVIPKVENCS
jgi:hypothetical protein